MFAHCRHVAVFAGKSLFQGERDSEQVYLITRRRATPGGREGRGKNHGRKERFKITLLIDAGKRVESKGNHRDAPFEDIRDPREKFVKGTPRRLL